MFDDYILGVTNQLERRVRELKLRIPRKLPRDYDSLAQACRNKLDSVVEQLQSLREGAEYARPETQPERTRRLKRTVADLDLLETAGIAALYRAREDDHKLNELLERITREIEYPLVTPIVTTLSQQYFYIYPELNLLCVPLTEGRFLLHLPDLYHELAHPLLVAWNEPHVEPFQKALDRALSHVLTYLQEERTKSERRSGPASFSVQLQFWEALWIRSWLVEFFCDLFGVFTLGPAFGWAHLHLSMMRGENPFEVPSTRWSSHPADDARMRAVLDALAASGFDSYAAGIRAAWESCLEKCGFKQEPEYKRCYPDALLRAIVSEAKEGVEKMGCRIASPVTADPVHVLLNNAWRHFWTNPGSYVQWEENAVNLLLDNAPVIKVAGTQCGVAGVTDVR